MILRPVTVGFCHFRMGSLIDLWYSFKVTRLSLPAWCAIPSLTIDSLLNWELRSPSSILRCFTSKKLGKYCSSYFKNSLSEWGSYCDVMILRRYPKSNAELNATHLRLEFKRSPELMKYSPKTVWGMPSEWCLSKLSPAFSKSLIESWLYLSVLV